MSRCGNNRNSLAGCTACLSAIVRLCHFTPPPPASSSGPTCSFSQGVAVNGNPWLAALAQQVVLYCCC
jgi:hypothetical protein